MQIKKIILALEEIRAQTKQLYKIIGNTIYLYREYGNKISLGEIRTARKTLKYYQDNCPHLEILSDHTNKYLWCNICGGFLTYYNNILKCYSDGVFEIFGEIDNIPLHHAKIAESKLIQEMRVIAKIRR